MHHRDGDNVTDFGFYQLGTHTDKVPILNHTTSGEDEKDYATTSVVADNRTKKVMTFADIVRDNQNPKSVVRVNPVIPSKKNHVPQKKQVVRFTLAWWKIYLDIFVTYRTAFVTWLL